MTDKALCGAVQAKFWGTTQCVFIGPYSEMHYLEIKKGGYCSNHQHTSKWNRFFLISGKLQITIHRPNGEDITILEPGQFTDVAPGVFHRFDGIEDSACNEIYWIDTIRSQDIERKDCGGMN